MNSSSTSRTVVAVFDSRTSAERAVSDLVNNGVSRQHINVTDNDRLASDAAIGNTGLSGQNPSDTSGGGIGGFFRRMFGADDEYAGRYDSAVRGGGTLVSVTTNEEDMVSDILDRNGAVDIDEGAESSGQRAYDSSPDAYDRQDAVRRTDDTADRSIPVVREEMHVGKRDVQRRGVRVFNRVEEQPVEEQVQLREEHVRVDRRPANRPATDADFRAQDEVIELTEMAEEPVVQKSARVVEEVVVGKETSHRTETIRDTVRRTDVNVENVGADARAYADYDDDFQQHFRSQYGSSRGADYQSYAPAYQYGYRMASDDRYRGRRWDDVEPTLRSDYERQNPGSTWEQMKDSIRYGWEKVTGRR